MYSEVAITPYNTLSESFVSIVKLERFLPAGVPMSEYVTPRRDILDQDLRHVDQDSDSTNEHKRSLRRRYDEYLMNLRQYT